MGKRNIYCVMKMNVKNGNGTGKGISIEKERKMLD